MSKTPTTPPGIGTLALHAGQQDDPTTHACAVPIYATAAYNFTSTDYAADLFALPAEGEGFSMAVLEALACGLPVLLTPGCHFSEAAEAGAGVVVPREVEALRAALVALLSDSDRRAAMGRAARALVEARYTWPQIVAQLETAYASVIARAQEMRR